MRFQINKKELEQKQTNNSNISSECKNIISDVLSSYVVQLQKRSGGLTNVNFKVLFGYLKSSLIGLRKQLSNVTFIKRHCVYKILSKL